MKIYYLLKKIKYINDLWQNYLLVQKKKKWVNMSKCLNGVSNAVLLHIRSSVFLFFFFLFLLKFGDHLFFSHSYIHNLSMFMQLWVEEYNDLVDMYSFGMCMFFFVKQHVHFLFLFWPNGETPRLSLVVLIPHLYSSHGIWVMLVAFFQTFHFSPLWFM